MEKIIAQGAEAIIIPYKRKNLVFKDRIKKSYRIPELDDKIRRLRTRSEIKFLLKASQIINVPIPNEELSQPEHFRITMPFIDGKKLSQELDNFPLQKQKQILKQIGKDVSKLHKANIIHGDLTTSNMIYVDENKNNFKIFFIDFGLGFFNGKYEDKAVDIHLLKQALEAKHFKNWKILFKEFEKGYLSVDKIGGKKVFERLQAVEKRGRYRH